MDFPVIFENNLNPLMAEIFLVFIILLLLIFGAFNLKTESLYTSTTSSTYGTETGIPRPTLVISDPVLYLSSSSLFLAGLLSLNGV